MILYNFNEKIDDKYLDISEIKKRKGEDIIGRHDNFNKVPLDSSNLIDNFKKYKDK